MANEPVPTPSRPARQRDESVQVPAARPRRRIATRACRRPDHRCAAGAEPCSAPVTRSLTCAMRPPASARRKLAFPSSAGALASPPVGTKVVRWTPKRTRGGQRGRHKRLSCVAWPAVSVSRVIVRPASVTPRNVVVSARAGLAAPSARTTAATTARGVMRSSGS